MSDITPLIPRQPVPALTVPLVGGGTFSLAAEAPTNFTMLVFYRGLHCRQCRKQLGELEKALPDFAKRGVSVLAVSCDPRDRAERAKQEWGLPSLRIGYGLELAKAREYGLWISTSRGMTAAGVEETKMFSEPGLFLVRPDGTLYLAAVQTMPFARPRFEDLLAGIDFALQANYAPRGEVTSLTAQAAE